MTHHMTSRDMTCRLLRQCPPRAVPCHACPRTDIFLGARDSSCSITCSLLFEVAIEEELNITWYDEEHDTTSTSTNKEAQTRTSTRTYTCTDEHAHAQARYTPHLLSHDVLVYVPMRRH